MSLWLNGTAPYSMNPVFTYCKTAQNSQHICAITLTSSMTFLHLNKQFIFCFICIFSFNSLRVPLANTLEIISLLLSQQMICFWYLKCCETKITSKMHKILLCVLLQSNFSRNNIQYPERPHVLRDISNFEWWKCMLSFTLSQICTFWDYFVLSMLYYSQNCWLVACYTII